MCLLVDDNDIQPTMAQLPMGSHANAVRWSPEGGPLAIAVGGLPQVYSSAAGRGAHATSAHLAERGSGQGHVRTNEAEERLSNDLSEGKAAVLLFSASGADRACAAQECLYNVAAHTLGQEEQNCVIGHDAAPFLPDTHSEGLCGLRQVCCSTRCACLPHRW